MNRKISIVLLLCVLVMVGSNIVYARQRAFRDFYWGDALMPLRSEHDLIKISPGSSDIGLSFWVKRNEDLQIGGEPVGSIVYVFFQNQLMSIIIRCHNRQFLSQVAQERFGMPVKSNVNPLDERYVEGDTLCHIEEESGEGVMRLCSLSILERYSRWEEQKTKEAAKDF